MKNPSILRRPSLRRFPILKTAFSAVVVALVTTVAGVAGTAGATPAKPVATKSSGGAPVRGGVLQWALAEDPLSMNPWGGGSGNDALYVTRQLFDTLTEQDPANGKILPFLASSWTVNSNATSFHFTLRSGVTFSDGSPLTAQVIKDNFDNIVASGASATNVAVDFIGYQGTTVTGPLTFTVNFQQPNGPFLQELSGVDIVSESTLKIPFQDRNSGNGVIGTGPFVLKSYTPGQSVILTRRAGYNWGPADRTNKGAAYLSGIDFKITPEPSVRTGVLTSNQVEGIDNVSPQDISTLRGDGYDVVERANPGIAFGLSFVEDHPIVSQLAVRQAIADAINPKAIQAAALTPDFAVATSILSKDTVGYTNLSSQLGYHPSKAKKLLSSAGWVPGPSGIREQNGQPLSLSLGWINNFAPNQTALQLLQAELKQVGVQVTLETGTAPEFTANLKAGKYDMVWGNLSNANAAVLRTNFSAQASNYYKINDPTLEHDFNEEYATSNQSTQNTWAAKAQERIIQERYAAPVFQLTTVLATAKSVHGVTLGADSRLAQLTDAWVGKANVNG